MSRVRSSLRHAAILFALVSASLALASFIRPGPAMAEESRSLASRFEELSRNGNSNCSGAFSDSIATMPATARLKGSCCGPMNLPRYTEQVNGLAEYADIAAIPSDPYDIPAGIAREAMSYYDVQLTGAERQAYDYAMANSDEKGPCCCQCWRWKVYGGLAKLLISEHGFTGEQVVKVWNLSNGCGGAG